MSRSHTTDAATERRRPQRASVSTAAGMAAERIARADRERRTAHVREAARLLEQRTVGR